MINNSIRALVLLTAVFCIAASGSAQGQARDDGESYLFQVVLLIGDNGGRSELEGVSANVQKALDDVKEFLPFKSYRVLDTALLRSAGRLEGLLSGPDGQDYRLTMVFEADPDAKRIHVHGFGLTDLGVRGAPTPPRGVSAPGAGSGDAVAPQASIRRTLIESSFSLGLGETIIVGSSKLNGGGEALLVLLTAIP
jgi:hypothetical protein